MANVIISEGFYDREFVSRYTHGWDRFVQRAAQYPLDKVEEITWVPAAKVRDAARLYAQTKPACIQWGVAIEQTINSTDNNRILADLMAITGNLDVPGGNVFFVPAPVRPIGEFGMHRSLPETQRQKRLGGGTYKLADRIAIVTPKMAWDAILTEEPYPVKAMLLHGTNPVITRANAREVYSALKQIDFLSVADFFMTPTAELADIVLPAATWLEFDDIGAYLFRGGYVFARPGIVQIGECWPDHRMFIELGKRMGQQEFWRDIEGDLDHVLEPSGMNFDRFLEKGYLRGKMEYRKYEKSGFPTPTGKFELYSTVFEKWGYDPLPQYREIPESPVSTPAAAAEYPHILITGARSPVFFHSEHRMVPWLREAHPDPIVEVHPDTAAKSGIKDGMWVFIETPRGRIKQKARLTAGIDPRVVAAEHGWWFPEVRSPDHGWDRSNINILTDNSPAGYDAAMGATNLRVLMCKISPAGEEA
jgi:anaerobic selenocysteine-containing dehydrogenase